MRTSAHAAQYAAALTRVACARPMAGGEQGYVLGGASVGAPRHACKVYGRVTCRRVWRDQVGRSRPQRVVCSWRCAKAEAEPGALEVG